MIFRTKKKNLLLTSAMFGSLIFAACTEQSEDQGVTSESEVSTMAIHISEMDMESIRLVSEEDHNRLVVMKYMEALSTSLREEVEAELMAPGYEVIRPEFANMDYHADGSQLGDMADPMDVAIANRRDSVDTFIAQDDMVVIRYRISGTHAGNFYGIPATGTDIDILAGAIFWLDGGKIIKSWWMADEAGFLRQVGQPLPARADGRWEAWPHVLPVRTGNDLMEEFLANPEDSQEYLNKLQLTAWKAPAYRDQVLHEDQSQRTGLRSGFFHIVNAAPPEMVRQYPFSGAFPDRVDQIATLIADGKRAVILFRLTATNSNSLVGIPAQDRQVAAYEFGYQEFDGEVWKFNMWFGDDLGLLLQLGGSQDHWFQNED